MVEKMVLALVTAKKKLRYYFGGDQLSYKAGIVKVRSFREVDQIGDCARNI